MVRFFICKRVLRLRIASITSEFSWGRFYLKGGSIGDFTADICDTMSVIVLGRTVYFCELPISLLNGQVYGLEFWYGGQHPFKGQSVGLYCMYHNCKYAWLAMYCKYLHCIMTLQSFAIHSKPSWLCYCNACNTAQLIGRGGQVQRYVGQFWWSRS